MRGFLNAVGVLKLRAATLKVCASILSWLWLAAWSHNATVACACCLGEAWTRLLQGPLRSLVSAAEVLCVIC